MHCCIVGNTLNWIFFGPYVIEKKLNNLNYIVVTPDKREQTQLCHVNMFKPYVERRSNLVKKLANVKVVVSEPKELSGELRSSHLSPIDTTKRKNSNVLLSHLEESQRQDLRKPLSIKTCFLMYLPGQIRFTMMWMSVMLLLLNNTRTG